MMKIISIVWDDWVLYVEKDRNGAITKVLSYLHNYVDLSRYEKHPNFIFEARLEFRQVLHHSAPVYQFKEVDGPNFFYMGQSNMSLFLRALHLGSVEVVNNVFFGRFKFRKQGNVYYIIPVS